MFKKNPPNLPYTVRCKLLDNHVLWWSKQLPRASAFCSPRWGEKTLLKSTDPGEASLFSAVTEEHKSPRICLSLNALKVVLSVDSLSQDAPLQVKLNACGLKGQSKNFHFTLGWSSRLAKLTTWGSFSGNHYAKWSQSCKMQLPFYILVYSSSS